MFRICLITLFLCPFFCFSQTRSETIYPSTSYRLENDTLITNTGYKIYEGLTLQVGSGSGINGIYQQIRFKTQLNAYLLLFHDAEMKTTYLNRVNPEFDRQNDILKELLHYGDRLVVKRITKKGNKKFGYWFYLLLKRTQAPHTKVVCNIELAVNSKEILL
ncbi:MAG: hypothetical protein EKK39_06255 [Sphingobacteriales bacterium]|uniref:hypothetical protein n=1 Tax=Hydrotalea flava TaxID=714549 RepID=UPI000FA2F00E|nr:hypothetical protein [Hydrotalea flava]RTL52777.1 MAG: hypothetical protein EKK39_06255 [Sphingobacteriales bacterium]